jgi:hypothetical protein
MLVAVTPDLDAALAHERQQGREDGASLCDRRMRTLIDYAVQVWGPESDVDPEADPGSMRADLETFLDVGGAAPPPEEPSEHKHGPWIRDPVHGSSDAFCEGCGRPWESDHE